MAIGGPLTKTALHSVDDDALRHGKGRCLRWLHHGAMVATMPAALPAPAPQEATPPKSKSKRKHSFLKRSHSCDCVPATDLPAEVCALKERLQSSCPAASFRFSFRCMKKVVVPPVTIPSQFSNPRALSTVVAGKKIPATKCMWTNQRHKLIKRMPDRIIEDMRYEEIRYA